MYGTFSKLLFPTLPILSLTISLILVGFISILFSKKLSPFRRKASLKTSGINFIDENYNIDSAYLESIFSQADRKITEQMPNIENLFERVERKVTEQELLSLITKTLNQFDSGDISLGELAKMIDRFQGSLVATQSSKEQVEKKLSQAQESLVKHEDNLKVSRNKGDQDLIDQAISQYKAHISSIKKIEKALGEIDYMAVIMNREICRLKEKLAEARNRNA